MTEQEVRNYLAKNYPDFTESETETIMRCLPDHLDLMVESQLPEFIMLIVNTHKDFS